MLEVNQSVFSDIDEPRAAGVVFTDAIPVIPNSKSAEILVN
jgi:hypothetical protein